MLTLKDVTLLATDTSCHELTRLAIESCLEHVNFAGVLVFTDKPDVFNGLPVDVRVITVAPWRNKYECAQALWHGVPPHVGTSHVLAIQWDSWVVDPTVWTDDFLTYDYIGAPWWHVDNNVGNGGFSLRSRALMQHVASFPERYHLPAMANEDEMLCRAYRPRLEAVGFRWASPLLASRFAFEHTSLSLMPQYFGIHGIFNWPLVLDGEALQKRMQLAKSNPYIAASGMV